MGRTANPDLTNQEYRVLELYAIGYKTGEIVNALSLDKRAVEWKIDQVKRKLKASTIAHAVYIGCMKGLL